MMEWNLFNGTHTCQLLERVCEGIVATESRLCYVDGDAGILSYQGFPH